jgi:hypothetical protein
LRNPNAATRPSPPAPHKNGEISRKHGNTLVGTLRKLYGQHFAPGFPETAKLSDVLQQLDEPSLSALVHDHEHGHLERKIAQHS